MQTSGKIISNRPGSEQIQQPASLWDAMRSAAGGVKLAIRGAHEATLDMLDMMAAPHRRRCLQELANHFSLRYHEDGGDVRYQWFIRFGLFQGGGGGEYANLIQGQFLNTSVRMFDFLPRIHHNDWRTVVVIKLLHSKVPLFALWPIDRVSGYTQFLGKHHAQVKLPVNSNFAKYFQLHASNVDAVLPLFGHDTRLYFTSHRNWSVEAGGEWLMFYHHNRRCRSNELRTLLTSACRAFRSFNLK